MAKGAKTKSMDQKKNPGLGSSPRLYQRAYEILAEQIGEGALRPGATLTETSVAAQFGVSRAPARQALAALAQAGLVEKTTGRGFAVKPGAAAADAINAARRAGDASWRAGDTSWRAGEEELRLVSQSSWERIHGEVEGEIVARTSFASWRVNEALLARHYGVSRTVARDVVARLQQRGIVRKDDSGRWYAPALTPGHVGELYELRWLLEPVALKKAAPRLPEDLLPAMRANLEDATARAHEIDGSVLDRLERELHVSLLGHCGNTALMQAITLPQSLLIAHHFLYRWTARMFASEPFLPEHLEVVDLLQAGRIDMAADALENHLRQSRDRAIARVGAIAAGPQPEPLPYLERLRN
jgi:DNA-binding GntR family transcriptional regulator